ncbi:hypothetical protein [Spirosoma luteum]|uniref:hypothetical protein n=1 Tax=Spirosoma luteum TaxID=431553 RepID=UPI00037E800B|nr:hypothetical protein [Spirosoma luteum]
MGAERQQIQQLALNYAAYAIGETVHRILSDREAVSAYDRNRTEVLLQDGTPFQYRATYPTPANGYWILEAVGKGAGVWVDTNYEQYATAVDGDVLIVKTNPQTGFVEIKNQPLKQAILDVLPSLAYTDFIGALTNEGGEFTYEFGSEFP